MTHEDVDNLYNSSVSNSSRKEEEIIKHAVLKLNSTVLAFVVGAACAFGIFVATNFLVLKGGDVVGPHMQLLDQFFYGYSVTFLGSIIGALYAFVVGFLGGLFIGWVYNFVVFLRAPKSVRNR
jgi:ABC-type dipeptide/oligopeptide/nickel transport system permease subunit